MMTTWRFVIRWLPAALLLAVAAGLAWHGRTYYLLPVAQRPDAPLHAQLGSARPVGHLLGWLGTAALVLLMAYSLRKRVRWLERAGPLRYWLHGHIVLGLLGPLLITFHSAFGVGGLVAIAYWSMILTMCSGLFGRYVYVQIASSALTGHQLLADAATAGRLDAPLQQRLDAWAARHSARVSGPGGVAGRDGLRAVALLLLDDLRRPWWGWHLRRQLRQEGYAAGAEVKTAVALLLRRQQQEQRTMAAAALDRVFHHWHVVHRPFVWIMFLVAALHIGVAWWLGYRGL